jgi:hypothetical protein
MNILDFAAAADFPPEWIRGGLFDDPFFIGQANEFEHHHGSAKPSGGTEHWRYAAFLHLLRANPTAATLQRLLDAALADPDPPMAGNVIKDIVTNPLATESMLAAALARIAETGDYYVDTDELIWLFQGSH